MSSAKSFNIQLNNQYQFKAGSCLNSNTPPGALGSNCNPNPLYVIPSTSNPTAVRLSSTTDPVNNPANCLGIYNGQIIANSDCQSTSPTAQIADFLIIQGNEPNTISFQNPQTQMCLTPSGPVACSTNNNQDFVNPIPPLMSLAQSGLQLNQQYQFKSSSCLNSNAPPGPLGSNCNPNPQTVIPSSSNPNALRLSQIQDPTNNPANCLGIYNGQIITNSDCLSTSPTAQIGDFFLINGNEPNTISFYNPQTQMCLTPSGPVLCSNTNNNQDFINPTITVTPPSAMLDWDQALQQANALQQQDLINGEIFQIVTDPVKNQCMTVDNTNPGLGGNLNSGGFPLTTGTCNASDLRQNFQYVPDTSNQGGNQIKSLYNNACMNILDTGNMSSLNDGSLAIMFACEPNPQFNNRFSTNADNTQPTPIKTFADKCLDTTGTNGTVVQNSCVFGKQGQYFQYQRVNPATEIPINLILNDETEYMNELSAAMVNNPANVPAVNNNENIRKYLKKQAEEAKKSQTSLLNMAKKSYHKLLKTKKKMYPVADKTKLASNSAQFITESFSGGSANPYRFSKMNETGLANDIELTNNKILQMMKIIQKKNNIISIMRLAIISLIYFIVIFVLYKNNSISKSTALIFIVILLIYVSNSLYTMFYNPAVVLNELAVYTNEVRENICKNL